MRMAPHQKYFRMVFPCSEFENLILPHDCGQRRDAEQRLSEKGTGLLDSSSSQVPSATCEESCPLFGQVSQCGRECSEERSFVPEQLSEAVVPLTIRPPMPFRGIRW